MISTSAFKGIVGLWRLGGIAAVSSLKGREHGRARYLGSGLHAVEMLQYGGVVVLITLLSTMLALFAA